MTKVLQNLYLFVEKLKNGEDGQDLVEYALLVTMISLSLVISVHGIASSLVAIFTNVSSSIA